MLFGAAAGASIPRGRVPSGALLLTLSTGCSWLVLGALLCLLTRKRALDLAEACLITMAYGEAVLVSGAGIDWVLLQSNFRLIDPVPLNVGFILVSNIVMAFVFVVRLRRLEVGVAQSLGLWLIGLNGSWPLFLMLFKRLLDGGK